MPTREMDFDPEGMLRCFALCFRLTHLLNRTLRSAEISSGLRSEAAPQVNALGADSAFCNGVSDPAPRGTLSDPQNPIYQ